MTGGGDVSVREKTSLIDEAVGHVRAGRITKAAAARIAGCHVTTIHRHLRAERGDAKPRVRRPPRDALLDLVEAHGITGAAERIGAKDATVRKWLTDYGVMPPHRPRRAVVPHIERLERGRMLRHRFLEHRSYADIARLEGVPSWAVTEWYRRNNLDTGPWRARLNGARRLLTSRSPFKRHRAEEEWAALWEEIIGILGLRKELEVL